MVGRTYQQLIADVLFWHSLDYDDDSVPTRVSEEPIDFARVISPTRVPKVVAARRDVAKMLRCHNPNVFSMNRIGQVLSRHHTTIVHYLYHRKHQPLPKRFEIPRQISYVEGLRL
jgi:hypothetical protein